MDKQSRTSTDQPAVRIDGEHETSNGWLYTFHIDWADGQGSDHELTLSWVDHEHLVAGTISPSVVAAVVAKIAAAHFGQENMPTRCDVSILRRRIDGFDEMVKAG